MQYNSDIPTYMYLLRSRYVKKQVSEYLHQNVSYNVEKTLQTKVNNTISGCYNFFINYPVMTAQLVAF